MMIYRTLARFRIASIVAVISTVALLTAMAAGCGDDDSGSSDQLNSIQASLDEIQESLDRTDLVATMGFLATVQFHAIDDEMQTAEEIPGGVAGRISNAHAVASSTHWPDDISDLANTLVAALADFSAALEADDLQASKGLATDTHDAYHDLEHDAYALISGEGHGGEGEGDGEDEGHDGEADEGES